MVILASSEKETDRMLVCVLTPIPMQICIVLKVLLSECLDFHPHEGEVIWPLLIYFEHQLNPVQLVPGTVRYFLSISWNTLHVVLPDSDSDKHWVWLHQITLLRLVWLHFLSAALHSQPPWPGTENPWNSRPWCSDSDSSISTHALWMHLKLPASIKALNGYFFSAPANPRAPLNMRAGDTGACAHSGCPWGVRQS